MELGLIGAILLVAGLAIVILMIRALAGVGSGSRQVEMQLTRQEQGSDSPPAGVCMPGRGDCLTGYQEGEGSPRITPRWQDGERVDQPTPRQTPHPRPQREEWGTVIRMPVEEPEQPGIPVPNWPVRVSKR
jgi:hypothetical protein